MADIPQDMSDALQEALAIAISDIRANTAMLKTMTEIHHTILQETGYALSEYEFSQGCVYASIHQNDVLLLSLSIDSNGYIHAGLNRAQKGVRYRPSDGLMACYDFHQPEAEGTHTPIPQGENSITHVIRHICAMLKAQT